MYDMMSEDGGKRKRTSDERNGSHDIQFEKEKNHKKTSVSSQRENKLW